MPKDNKKDISREMPHSIEAEQALLGCVIIDGDLQTDLVSALEEDDFYSESHKCIFDAMKSIILRNEPVDIVTLTAQLEKDARLSFVGGITYVTSLTQLIPSTANYKRYLDIVKRDGVLRKLIRSSTEIIEKTHENTNKEEAVAFAEKKIFDIATEMESGEMNVIAEVLPKVLNKFDLINKDKNAFSGVKTGFTELDKVTKGLQPSDLILIAARPGYGKTSLAMNIVENSAINGRVCAVFSLEMGKEQLAQRMICSVAEVPVSSAINGTLNKEQWLRLEVARKKLNAAKIFIDDSAMISVPEMMSKCRRLKRKHGLDLVMIDYIQLMGTGDKKIENRQQEISLISRSLKILAKEINVPVVALSQLSRLVESRTGHKPQLSDLRESGAIEQDADMVMFIHRPDKNPTDKDIKEGKVEENVAQILIEKFRNGSTGMFKLYFNSNYTKFVNYYEDDKAPVTGRDGADVRAPQEEYPDGEGNGEREKDVDDELFDK